MVEKNTSSSSTKMIILILGFVLLAVNHQVVASAGEFIYQNRTRLDFVKNRIQAKDPYYLNAYNSLITHANKALLAKANPVVNKTQLPPSGDIHDYLSLAPYWWPDSSKKDGLPWIRKDGLINPKTRGNNTDQQRLSTLFNNIKYLSFAYYLSEDMQYANKVKSLIQVWFIDEQTMMNPNVNYGQGVPGRNTGREFGIIEFEGINAVVTAMEMMEQNDLVDDVYVKSVKDWFTSYLYWLQNSALGIREGNTKNNHAVWYDHQLIGIQLYLEKTKDAIQTLEAFKTKRIEAQIAMDGSLPHELKRTKSVNYCTMNMRGLMMVAEMGSIVGIDLLNYISDDGRGIKKALYFLKPYVEGNKEWTWKQIKGGGSVQAIEDKMKPACFGIAKSIYQTDFVSVSNKVHENMSFMDRIIYPYNYCEELK